MAQVSPPPRLVGGSPECPLDPREGHPLWSQMSLPASFIGHLLQAAPHTTPTLSPVKPLVPRDVGICEPQCETKKRGLREASCSRSPGSCVAK